MSTRTFLSLSLLLSLSIAASASAEGKKFYTDDPLRVDDDRLDVPVKPEEIELSDLYDRFGHIFKDWGASPLGTEAANVNTLDEVPDSSWFTNRLGRPGARPSSAELARGPNRGPGPDPEQTWTVFRSKSQGLTPGFQIYDESGERYVIKLDPPEVPELASAAEVISTKIFHALGYNVPENYIVRVHPDRFVIEPGTEVEDSFGDKTPLTPFRFRRMIRRVPRDEQGRMRVTASKYIAGIPIGPFRYYETRSDDPNDVIPHEDRRELRGLRLFAAWTNHDDTRAQNTQASWVEEDGRHYVKHFLIDFGSTLGSGSVDIQLANLGFEYWLDLDVLKKNLVPLGLHVPRYRKAHWPEFPEHRAIGRIEAELFDPASWKNDYPNPAFVRMTARDAFWAAKLLMKLSREDLAAIVETGEYGNAEDTSALVDVLVARQLACGRFGIDGVNPLDEFRVEDGALSFANLSETYGFTGTEIRYVVRWSAYDNETGAARRLGDDRETVEPRAVLPASPGSGVFLLAEIRSLNAEHPHWRTPVSVYLRRASGSYRVVGVDRVSPEPVALSLSMK